MCDTVDDCCSQLEAEPLHTNEQLLAFEVRSKGIAWEQFVEPLRSRAPPVYLKRQFGLMSNFREPIGDHNRREVLLCHDMMGNYLEDRHYNSSRKFDDYRFHHWTGVDYFCYFSHKYVTVPPCGWINAAHKHGVRVLGTFKAEGSEGSRLLHEALQSTEMVNHVVEALLKLCKHYCFEGWLLNIECKVNADAMENLFYFVQRLRVAVEKELDHGIVFWYDSVVETGELQWQNELNARNVRFFRSADATLINYAWTDGSLERTTVMCEQELARCQRAFFGIDVFGRGQVAKFQSKQTLARIASRRFSAGIFAPAWTYETLRNFGYDIQQPLGGDEVNNSFLHRNEKFWWSLWEHIATHPYNRLPFFTDFCLGSGKRLYKQGVVHATDDVLEGRFFSLSQQSLQPSVPLYELAEHYYEDAYHGGSCLRILHADSSFRLFVTDFLIQRGALVFAYAYKLNEHDGELDCILRFCADNNEHDSYLFLGDYYDSVSMQRGRCYVSPYKPKYNHLLTPLEHAKLPKELTQPTPNANGWRVRYYVVEFDGPVQVKDIGVLYRRRENATDTAYLGAIYMNDVQVNSLNFPRDSNITLIEVYGGNILN